jgi:hypothetical protein
MLAGGERADGVDGDVDGDGIEADGDELLGAALGARRGGAGGGEAP